MGSTEPRGSTVTWCLTKLVVTGSNSLGLSDRQALVPPPSLRCKNHKYYVLYQQSEGQVGYNALIMAI